MHRFPLHLGFVLRFPNRKIYGFSILTQNLTNVINNIGKICAENHINIINIKISTSGGGGGNAHIPRN